MEAHASDDIIFTGQLGVGQSFLIGGQREWKLSCLPGKTCYLTYCLMHRLVSCQPTCYMKTKLDRYVFLPSGVYHAPRDSFFAYHESPPSCGGRRQRQRSHSLRLECRPGEDLLREAEMEDFGSGLASLKPIQGVAE